MLIENPDAFKAWLTSVLEPLCDADPEALAKYVYALVKKDKSVDALRDVMIEQLDVFLQKETKPFVELLFKTLEKQEYLTPATPIPNTNPPNPNVPVVSVKTEVNDISIPKDVKPIIPVSSLPDLTLETVNGTAPVKKEKETEAHKKEREREPKKSDSEKDDKARSGGRTRHRSTSRNRSRSRSWDRVRRTRSRDRSREPRERRDRSRPWRNKSPPRRYERRRSRSISPVRNRSRSPRHTYRSRYRNRSPTRSPTRSRSRSLDKHTDKEKVKDSKELPNKDPLSGAGTPTQDSNHGDTDMRLTSSTQSIQSVVAANSDVIVQPHVAPATVFTNKRRCRDFDEKGYCMRGELCPYDHGIDPVVLEDTALSSVLTFGPNGQPPLDGHPAPPALLPPMIRPSAGHMIHQHHLTQRPPLHPVMPAEYNPSAPSMWNARPGFRGPMGPRAPGLFTTGAPIMGPQPNMSGPSGTHNHVQRELINVPVIDNSIPPDSVYPRTTDFINVQENNIKKKGFDFNRLGPRTKNPVNCSLELKKVPRGLNNITHLNNHFSKFGKIVNIQVCFEGDPEAALITFSSHAEANAAYRSTEAVLNNRFIKVFWHNNNNNGEGKQENIPPVQRSVKERLGQNISPLAPMNSNKVLNLVQPKVSMAEAENVTNDKVVNNLTKNNVYVPSSKKDPVSILESKAQANAAIKKGQEILAAKEQLKKKQEEKRKEAVKLTQDLIKRKQELLDKQITQQKILIGKLESGSVKGQQKDDLKKAIHTLHQSIEDIRKSLIAAVKQKSSSRITQAAKITHIRKSKEEAQKEILDAELDLITKQQQGADTSDLVKKVTELKKQAQSLGIPSSRRGHMTLRIPRGNKFARVQRHSFSHSSIDHRPTKLLVSGYESDEEFQVLAHFAKFGEVTNFLCDNFTPSVILNYKTRKEAELAMLKGKQFQDRTLSITWCTNTQLSNKLSTNRHQPRTVLLEEPDEDHLLNATLPDEEAALEGVEGVDLSEEALLQDDEEEEEENEEDRSWRR